MNIKQGAGNTEGDLYQLWLGVLKIKDWTLAGINLDEREKFWLEQEIGSSNAGIFDDIQVLGDIVINTQEHDDIQDKTASDTGNYAFPSVACRAVVKIFTSGTLTATFIQSF